MVQLWDDRFINLLLTHRGFRCFGAFSSFLLATLHLSSARRFLPCLHGSASRLEVEGVWGNQVLRCSRSNRLFSTEQKKGTSAGPKQRFATAKWALSADRRVKRGQWLSNLARCNVGISQVKPESGCTAGPLEVHSLRFLDCVRFLSCGLPYHEISLSLFEGWPYNGLYSKTLRYASKYSG